MKRFQTRTLLLLGSAIAISGAVAVISLFHALRHFEGELFACTEDRCWSQRHFPSSERLQACAQRFGADLYERSGDVSNTFGLADYLHAKKFNQCLAHRALGFFDWDRSVCAFLYLDLCRNENYKPYLPPRHNQQLPDSQYIGFALQITQLARSFTPQNARKQFAEVKQYLWGPAVSKYEAVLSQLSPEDIETKQLSQKFSVNERQIKVTRYPELEQVTVNIPGSVETTPADFSCRHAVSTVKMTTIPRKVANEYGIIITDFEWKCEP